jgi:iron complex outermembrane recepter protein
MAFESMKVARKCLALLAVASVGAPSGLHAQQSLPDITINRPKIIKPKVVQRSHRRPTIASNSSAPASNSPPAPSGNSEAPSPAGKPLLVGAPATVSRGYVPLTTTAGTKTATPIIEIPQSITVVTRKELDDRDVQTLSQALDYTASVRTGAFGYDPRFDSFYLRGFDMTYTGIYRDGLRQPAAPFGIFKTEPYGLDSIVVVKGPSSALYGLGSPGGLIDLQSKRPTLETLREVQLQPGNYDRYQGNFDLGGAIDKDGVYSYRLTGLFRDSDTWLPGAKDNRDFIAPAFAYRPDQSTSVIFLSEYMNSRTTGNSAYYQTPEGILTNIYQGDPQFTNFDQNQFRVGYEFEHKFNDNITFRQNARFAHCQEPSWLENFRIRAGKAIKRENISVRYSHV